MKIFKRWPNRLTGILILALVWQMIHQLDAGIEVTTALRFRLAAEAAMGGVVGFVGESSHISP
jgi:hypothetical protein